MIRMALISLSVTLLASAWSNSALGQEDKIKLDTTRIKANKELPQILYIVPWKDFEVKKEDEHKLKLHDFFGELYQPVLPSQIREVVATPQ